MLLLPNAYDADALSEKTALKCDDHSLTHQSFKEECDINTIIDRFGISGELPENLFAPQNEDFIETFDFQSAMNQIIEAEKSFMQLPAKVRTRFNNDPGLYVNFCSNPENIQEMLDLGLAVRRAPEAPAFALEPSPKEGSNPPAQSSP
ncbi:MAG: internal scaffolding protein [Microvirus sp.]|nr:MAG: internal scaffolding protein [Microvirus sp.]